MHLSALLCSKTFRFLVVAAVSASPFVSAQAQEMTTFDESAQAALVLMSERSGQSPNAGLLIKSNQGSKELPANLEETQSLFIRSCGARGVERSFTVEKLENEQELLTFTCRSVFSLAGQKVTTFVLRTSENRSRLEDLQVMSFDANFSEAPKLSAPGGAIKTKIRFGQPKMEAKEVQNVVLAVGVSSLASGAFARDAYAGDKDKLKHVLAGNFIASVSTIVAHYGFELSENKSALTGFGLAVFAGLLKEVYDSNHRDRHTSDSRDFWATAAGGAFGAFSLQVTFKF